MKIPEMNHHANSMQNAVPVQRWQTIANRFSDTGRVYRRALLTALFAASLHAQQFDVASVKGNKSNDQPSANIAIGPGAVYTPTGGFFSAKNIPLMLYIAFAWKIGGSEYEAFLQQLPQWVTTDRFDIQARPEGNPDKDTMRAMMRSLLSERFKLALHSEKRETPVSAFVLSTPGKLGPQLRLHAADAHCTTQRDPFPPPANEASTVAGGFPLLCGGIYRLPPQKPADQRIGARAITIELLARSLPTTETNRPLIDRTGISGAVDLILEWLPVRTGPPPATAPDPDLSGPTFAEALRKQLGVRLESTKAPVDVLVLDHVEHLIENCTAPVPVVGKCSMPTVPASTLLRETIERELPNLRALSDEAASQNDGRPNSWTRKQELGHLIDSATNNHIRIVLAGIHGEFRGEGYAQEEWVEAHGYRDLRWNLLVELWYRYNELLAALMARVPESRFESQCLIGSSVVTLRFVMEDYVLHMQHHIDHILVRERITSYPGAAAAV